MSKTKPRPPAILPEHDPEMGLIDFSSPAFWNDRHIYLASVTSIEPSQGTSDISFEKLHAFNGAGSASSVPLSRLCCLDGQRRLQPPERNSVPTKGDVVIVCERKDTHSATAIKTHDRPMQEELTQSLQRIADALKEAGPKSFLQLLGEEDKLVAHFGLQALRALPAGALKLDDAGLTYTKQLHDDAKIPTTIRLWAHDTMRRAEKRAPDESYDWYKMTLQSLGTTAPTSEILPFISRMAGVAGRRADTIELGVTQLLQEDATPDLQRAWIMAFQDERLAQAGAMDRPAHTVLTTVMKTAAAAADTAVAAQGLRTLASLLRRAPKPVQKKEGTKARSLFKKRLARKDQRSLRIVFESTIGAMGTDE